MFYQLLVGAQFYSSILSSVNILPIMTVEHLTAAEVTLTVCGPPNNGSTVTLCPNHDYLICFKCSVKNHFSFQWKLEPLDSAIFTPTNLLGQISRPNDITLILSNKVVRESNENDYESQLEIPTYILRDAIGSIHDKTLEITCQASTTSKKIIFINVAGVSFIQGKDTSFYQLIILVIV